MARKWFFIETSIGLDEFDLIILNRAVRHLIDDYDMSPTARNLSMVSSVYKSGMSSVGVIAAVNNIRGEIRARG